MPAQKTSTTLASDPDKVDAWMDALDHPLKPVAQALRTIILAADKTVGEHIKWNHPAFFYTGEMKPFDPKEYKRHLIVFNLQSKDGGVLLVFPHGARADDPSVYAVAEGGLTIEGTNTRSAVVRGGARMIAAIEMPTVAPDGSVTSFSPSKATRIALPTSASRTASPVTPAARAASNGAAPGAVA